MTKHKTNKRGKPGDFLDARQNKPGDGRPAGSRQEKRLPARKEEQATEEEPNWTKFGLGKKIALLMAIITVMTLIWFSGFEVFYARILVGASNVTLGMAGRESTIEVADDGETYFFRVTTIIEGRRGSYPQIFGALLLPVVMVISWQIFMAFFLKRKRWIKYTLINMGIFMAVQMVFLLLLTAYYTSDTARYLYDMMMDSFYIVALAVILVDNIRHPVFLSLLQRRLAG